jgi:hypothetical protein
MSEPRKRMTVTANLLLRAVSPPLSIVNSSDDVCCLAEVQSE